MLSREDNELLCRVGPGTVMGTFLRQFWHPALFASEVEADGAPVRVRLLSEDLIAFRDSSGQVGLVANNCPHRGASMFFGRNEEEGLRCVYHGWKFDRSGACVDMPNEPPESNFKHKVKIAAYPCRERNGLVWAYLGPLADPPELPDVEWATLPEEQRFISKRVQENNWVQGFEGGIDSSHSAFLHRRLDRLASTGFVRGGNGLAYNARDKHPHFETVETEFGTLIAARRNVDEETFYWRITPFLMPYYNVIPAYGPSPTAGGLAWVPMDDTTTMVWSATWHPTRALSEDERAVCASYPGGGIHMGKEGLLPPTTQPGGAWRPRANASNNYELDRELQKDKLFFGIANLSMQDQAVQESMGAIMDRTREHLGSSDAGIIAVRRRLLKAARELAAAGEPQRPDGARFRVRSAAFTLPKSEGWLSAAQPHLQLVAGKDYVAV